MPFIGNKPSAVPLTSADITDGIIVNDDIANSTINLTTKVTGTLPVANGGTGLTALGTAGQALVVNGGATALSYSTVGATAGQVIQVVTATDSTERSTTSSAYVTGSNTLAVSITPSSASNKILIITSFLTFQGTGRGTWSLYRGSTNLTPTGIMYNDYNANAVNVYIGYSYLDSPASTSSLTYQPYMKITTGTAYMNVNNSVGTMTALEVKG